MATHFSPDKRKIALPPAPSQFIIDDEDEDQEVATTSTVHTALSRHTSETEEVEVQLYGKPAVRALCC